MEINLTRLEEHFEKVKYPVTVLASIEEPGSLTFQAGKPEMNGGLRIYLTVKEMEEILYLNKIIGPGSKVQEIIDDRTNKIRDPDSKIDEFIYGTLCKYISQMLLAGLGKIVDKNIIPLPNHKDNYFRDSNK